MTKGNDRRPGGPEDGHLIEACLAGDEAAWEALVRRYQRLVYSIPIRYGLTEEAAGDVFQSVCVSLLTHLPAIEDRGRLASWLITTATRETWRTAGRGRREAPIGEGGDAEGDGRALPETADDRPLAEEEQIRLEERQQLREAVDRLPDRCRELIGLLYFSEDRLSYEEISRRTGTPVASIGPTRARCLEKLRKAMNG